MVLWYAGIMSIFISLFTNFVINDSYGFATGRNVPFTGYINATYMPYTLHYYHGSIMVKCVKTNTAIPVLTKYHE